MKGSHFVLGASLIALAMGGCASTSQTGVADANDARDEGMGNEGAQYAAALDDAFDAYEADVETALGRTYESEFEALTVARSHGEQRFDLHLEAALAERGLDVEGLAEYARTHPTFFHQQQEQYWGRLATLSEAAAGIANQYEAGPVDAEVAALLEAEPVEHAALTDR